MGVKGLWKILDPISRPISNPDVLEGQKVAIDASIWLYQFIRVLPPTTSGYSPLILSGLFNRLCKLLYFNIKPILVFDGAAPALKKRTTRERAERKGQAEEKYKRVARKLAATNFHLNEIRKVENADDTFEGLDETVEKEKEESYDEFKSESSENELDEEFLDRVNSESDEFKRLPIDMQQEILLAKRERIFRQHLGSVCQKDRMINSLEFSNKQVEALVKRRKVAEELEKVVEGTVVDYEKDYLQKNPTFTKKIASDSNKRYLLIKNSYGGWSIDGTSKSKNEVDQDDYKESANVNEKELTDDDDDFLFGKPQSPIDEKKNSSRDVVFDKLVSSLQPSAGNQEVIESDSKVNDLSFDPQAYLVSKEVEEKPIESSPSDKLGIPIEIVDGSVKPVESFPISITNLEDTGNKSLPEEPVVNLEEKLNLENNDIVNEVVNRPAEVKESIDEDLFADELVDELVQRNPVMSGQDNLFLIEKLQLEMESLRKNVNPAMSANIDGELIEDFKELLTIMGIPWIVAPGEAEAQCSWFQKENIVDAVVSDDNDSVVFGSGKTYRHFFTSSKKINMYLLRDIERELKLDQISLILLAILLGSDYSVGIRGIGPVKAKQLLSIVSSIGETNIEYQINIIKDGLLHGIWPEDKISDENSKKFLQKLFIQCAINDERQLAFDSIRDQYQNPAIDDNTSSNFKWKFLPDLVKLYSFLRIKLNWNEAQCKKIIEPIVARQCKTFKNKQKNLDSFLYR